MKYRAYDALQYPLMFCKGEDGYDFKHFKVDPITKEILTDAKGQPKK